MATRFASLPAPLAWFVLGVIALLVAAGLSTSPPPPVRVAASPAGSDAALYRAIVTRTAATRATISGYYRAAVVEHRLRGYPLRPFVAVRQPALALLSARLGPTTTLTLYRLLVVIALATLAWRLRGLPSRIERVAAPAVALLSLPVLLQPVLVVWHEAWAAALLALALAVRPGRVWPIAIVAALAATLIRELAAPAMIAFAFMAIAERRRTEAIGWMAAFLLFAGVIALHAHAVAGATLATDLPSPGWTRFGGWPFLLAMAHGTSLFAILPLPLAAIALPLALLGWGARATRTTDGIAIALAAAMLPFAIVGRPENIYWGLIVAPLLPVGLVFAPAALRDLLAAARQGRSASPSVRPWTAPASS